MEKTSPNVRYKRVVYFSESWSYPITNQEKTTQNRLYGISRDLVSSSRLCMQTCHFHHFKIGSEIGNQASSGFPEPLHAS